MIQFLNWLFRKVGLRVIRLSTRQVDLPLNVLLLSKEAERLSTLEEPKPQSGEYKRHQVYARMLKNHPEVPRYDISFSIEVAIRRLKGKGI